MPGLIQGAMVDPIKPLTSLKAYEPEKSTLDPGTDTVAGRVKSLVAEDSPFMQQARTNTAQAANSRGILNSSMALQAGEQAVLNTALPIAQADAGASLSVKQANTSAGNRGSEFNATTANTAALQERQGQQATELQTLRGTQDVTLQNLRGQQAEKITQIEGEFRETLQASAAAAQLYAGTSKYINDVMRDPNLDEASKQAAIDRNIDVLRGGLAIIGGISGIPGLTALLSF